MGISVEKVATLLNGVDFGAVLHIPGGVSVDGGNMP